VTTTVVEPASGDATRGARGDRLMVVAVLAVLCVPLAIVAVALRSPRWYPVLDLTMTELRVRDVGTSDTPLIGLPGRIGTIEEQGSHPGPASFYALAPVYRLLGSSAWALQVATLVLHATAMGVCLVVARRRGGPRFVLAVGALLGVLSLAYGFQVLTEPWNPYMPLFWWVAFLLAAWGVLAGDWWLLPVAAVAASLCAQTHLPYLGLCGVIGVGVTAFAIWGARRNGGWPPGPPLLVAAGVVAVLWAPVAIDQITNDPGNLTLLEAHLTDPPGDSVGLRAGARVMLVHLDPTQVLGGPRGLSGGWVDRTYDPQGTVLPGLAVLAVWATAAVATWRRGPAALRHLNVLLAVALVLGTYSATSIFGKLWYYLTLWAWGLGVLMLGAVAWALLSRWRSLHPPPPVARDPLAGVLVAVLVACAAVLSVEAVATPPPAEPLSRALSLVMAPTLEAIEAGTGAASGPDGTYVVTWSDAMHFGSQGYSLVSELEREGYRAGFVPFSAVPGTTHRVIPPGAETARLHLASGVYIDELAADPDAVEVAWADPRSETEREEYAALREALLEGLPAVGLDDLVPWVDTNVFGVAIDTRLPLDLRRAAERMLDLGLPLAVFVLPPGAEQP
jgi:hypothetical protein